MREGLPTIRNPDLRRTRRRSEIAWTITREFDDLDGQQPRLALLPEARDRPPAPNRVLKGVGLSPRSCSTRKPRLWLAAALRSAPLVHRSFTWLRGRAGRTNGAPAQEAKGNEDTVYRQLGRFVEEGRNRLSRQSAAGRAGTPRSPEGAARPVPRIRGLPEQSHSFRLSLPERRGKLVAFVRSDMTEGRPEGSDVELDQALLAEDSFKAEMEEIAAVAFEIDQCRLRLMHWYR
jgi:hypothetical protein